MGWVRLGFAARAVPLAGFSFRELVFARQGSWLIDRGCEPGADETPALSQQIEHCLAAVPGAEEVLVEAPDGDEGRRLWRACRSLQEAASKLLPVGSKRTMGAVRLHLTLLSRERVVAGVAPTEGSSPHPGGIPRLRRSRDAPSRSALKLEEALEVFLDGSAGRLLRPGMSAVDLGAAPGGWSWVLARRGLRVVAVDNGPLGRGATETGLVETIRADGFTYRPPRPVEWLVCDMVAPPARVAKLIGLWARQGLCRRAVFNLKLPSGARWAEVRRCAAIVSREVGSGGGSCQLCFKHLYHDREEVTGYLQVMDTGERRPGAVKTTPPGRRGQRGRRKGVHPGGGRRRAGRRRRNG